MNPPFMSRMDLICSSESLPFPNAVNDLEIYALFLFKKNFALMLTVNEMT